MSMQHDLVKALKVVAESADQAQRLCEQVKKAISEPKSEDRLRGAVIEAVSLLENGRADLALEILRRAAFNHWQEKTKFLE